MKIVHENHEKTTHHILIIHTLQSIIVLGKLINWLKIRSASWCIDTDSPTNIRFHSHRLYAVSIIYPWCMGEFQWGLSLPSSHCIGFYNLLFIWAIIRTVGPIGAQTLEITYYNRHMYWDSSSSFEFETETSPLLDPIGWLDRCVWSRCTVFPWL